MSVNWDLKSAWRGIATLVDSFNAQGPGTFDALMDQLAQDPMGPMIHPRRTSSIISRDASSSSRFIHRNRPGAPSSGCCSPWA
ncbi:MAG: hypothetical protein Ct9H300mP1_26530 [Planctomycetaceae bacterium]|nr:MAG: hypothetical protein Ct9H300mP1_26530 [Planctomycetaceae bacterium]